ncbi:MAG: ABC transporter permease, partial [Planctomycetota bacterium]
PTDESVVVNQALADELWPPEDGEINSYDQFELTLRIPKPVSLPADSALGQTDGLIESLVRLKISKVIPNESLGRFALAPTQTESPNIFVSIELLQDALSRSALQHKSDDAQANAILIAGSGDSPPDETVSAQLKASLRPTLEDCGLSLKRVTQEFTEANRDPEQVFDYWSISSDQMVISDELADAITATFPNARPAFTYLANDIRIAGSNSGVPFSMVSAIDFDDDYRLTSTDGSSIETLKDDEIVLNRWTAENIGASVGDEIEITFYEPETTHGNQVAGDATFTLAAIAELTAPVQPFRFRRGELRYAQFAERPTMANDPDLTPEVPGVTDSASIREWQLPFNTAERIRPEDDDYWNDYRTTPKGFVTLEAGQGLWHSRFGEVTSFRIPATSGTREEMEQRLLDHFVENSSQPGFHLVPVKRQAIKASSGSTPFDVLFLALSMFVIASALALVSLLFRLGLQTRAAEVGVMKAAGIESKTILGIWLREMMMVCAFGAVIGILIGVGYAAVMIYGLRNWWVGAIGQPFIELHIGWISLVVGLLSGVIVCLITIWWSLRSNRNQPVREMLAGKLEEDTKAKQAAGWTKFLVPVLIVGAIGLSAAAASLSGDAQAGAFMGSGFLVLTAILIWVYRWLRSRNVDTSGAILNTGLGRLAILNARRNPLRSTLTISLVAVASFLIVAVSSFRLAPTESGTAGFDYIATTSQSLVEDLNTEEGQRDLLGESWMLPAETQTYSFRLKPGQDASCNNLYQSTQPRVLGVSESFVSRFDDEANPAFAFAATTASSDAEKANPWRLLDQPQDDGAIPVIIDKNTANYSLKIFATGGIYEVDYDSGESVKFRVVGFLSNTILQGSLIVSEKNFRDVFPTVSGYRFFLIKTGQGEVADESDSGTDDPGVGGAIATLESRLGMQGFDARPAERTLREYMSVQNTYLSTFQSLGLLGLLLGTFGLGAVQMRSVLERTRELGLMRAVGFARSRLAQMILLENTWLLLIGLAAGLVSAICATLPHYFVGAASLPWLQLAGMFALVVVVGLVAGLLASRLVNRIPLLDSLR